MRLSKIKLSGFKSFVDPTTIQFPSNLLGIVGPNGCGKSNVVDAVRWVLGEGSAKTLRGDSMADVIFNGSSGRKPVGQASIELTFDNTDGTIAGAYAGFSEVSVRRIVSRDGTSQYYLNNGRCRRKDITHILLGTGLGSHGYSIIEQGMISRLVDAKPEELRAFLEEAAGISKYKERRRETEHRIRRTHENLERLTDLRDELATQINHLQRQAKAAERYKKLKAEGRRVGAELLALRLSALRAEVAEQERALKERQLALEAATTAQRSVESQIEQQRVELADGNDDFNEVQGRYYRIGAEIARLEQSVQHRKDTVRRQREDLAETEAQLGEITSHIADDRIELEELDQVLSKLNPGLEAAYAQQHESGYALEVAEQRMETSRERFEQMAQDFADAKRTVEVEEARIEQLGAQCARLANEQQARESEHDALSPEALELELETLIGKEEKLKAVRVDASHALDSAWEQIQQLRGQDKRISDHLDHLREALQNDRGRLSSLKALQAAALGTLSEQVQGWLEANSLSDSGSLAESLVVEPGWARAVETVLGSYLQAVPVENIDTLATGLTELTDGGLALIEDGEGAQRYDALPTASRLADKIQAPAAAASLVAGIRAADSLEAALLARNTLKNGESIVTREGIWIGPNWLRINRSDDPQVGVIERGDEIDALGDSIAQAAQRVDEVARSLTDTRVHLEQIEQVRAKAQTETTHRQELYSETKTQLESTRTKLEQMGSQRGALDRAIEDLLGEQTTLLRSTDEARERLRQAAAHSDELEQDKAGLERDRERQHELVVEARMQADEDRDAAQAIAIKVESRRSTKESASAALERVKAQQQHLLKRQTELAEQIEAAAEPLQSDEQTLVEQLDARLGVEQALSRARSKVEDIDAKLREAQGRLTEKQTAVGEARDSTETARLSVREAQVRAEAVGEQLSETGFDLETLLADLPDTADSTEWTERLERIDRRINRLGAINLAAIDEFEEQSQRKQYLDTQHADLSEALETLENAIRKIDRETRSRFKETFDKANQGLTRIFPRLFGGGHAFLDLDGEDLLHSGVTVMARPPGKKISTIHLLSGGEKALTAVALVFAIFELNPAPFCLLDEVDAPLDDANVRRFSEIVQEMAKQVQFILITHNKTTMEAMHQLAGVTMDEPGVSRLVVVDIDEAVQLAAS